MQYLFNALLFALLAFISFDDLRHYRIRNEAILALLLIFGAFCLLGGGLPVLVSHGAFALLMSIVMLGAYARGIIGGGDAKLLMAAFLWIGPEPSVLFALALLGFAVLYAVGTKLGLLPFRLVEGRTKVPFGPCIAAAWITTVIASGTA